jgi:glycosyltransferase involved in cell wall biosynthesis
MSIALVPPASITAIVPGHSARPAAQYIAPPVAPRRLDEFDGTRLWRKADAQVELTVVVPFYNPGAALRPTVERLIGCLRAEGVGFEVIAVSDGSTDGSERTLGGLGREVRVVVNPANQGKGAALHLGFARARGAWVGFIDADGDIDPAHLVEYLRLGRAGQHAAVYADKRHADSVSAATGFRKLVSLSYSTLVTVLFFLGIRDTQTGCKIIRRDVLAGVLPKLRERRFAFDLEFFVAAKAAGFHNLLAAPVRLEARLAGSTVTSKAILRTIRDTFVIFGRRHLQGQYGPVAASPLRELATGLHTAPERVAVERIFTVLPGRLVSESNLKAA